MADDEKNESLFEALDNIQEAYKELEKDQEEIVNKLDDETKIAVTRWVFKHVVNHAKDGGSYRYLIYDRLGFGMEAYVPLCEDGMTISNCFDLKQLDEIRDIVKENKIDVLKNTLGLCDFEDCYESVSCGFPTKEGYRTTCHKHYKELKEKMMKSKDFIYMLICVKKIIRHIT